MIHNTRENNILINDPVPRNVSKFPIHQTYLTSDSERTGTGGYKFKAPEVWSSARSGKKSIAIRSIQPILRRISLAFSLYVQQTNAATHESEEDFRFIYSNVFSSNTPIVEVIEDIVQRFTEWATVIDPITSEDDENVILPGMKLNAIYSNNTLKLRVQPDNQDMEYSYYKIKITNTASDTTHPSESFNEVFNQSKSLFLDLSEELVYTNVWDRETKIYFHASFIPFDNYQFLGELNDEWNNPIIYQDPNTSPLFNIWTTTDLKTPFPILHENFIIRMTFIISSDSQYHT